MKTAILTLALSIVVAGSALAQEHPEHPKPKAGDEKKTHAEHAYSMDELEKAITSEINAAQASNDGWYKMEDKDSQKTWMMKLSLTRKANRGRLPARKSSRRSGSRPSTPW